MKSSVEGVRNLAIEKVRCWKSRELNYSKSQVLKESGIQRLEKSDIKGIGNSITRKVIKWRSKELKSREYEELRTKDYSENSFLITITSDLLTASPYNNS